MVPLPPNLSLDETLHSFGDGWAGRGKTAEGKEVAIKAALRGEAFWIDEETSRARLASFRKTAEREMAAAAAEPAYFIPCQLIEHENNLFKVRPFAIRSLRDWVSFKQVPSARQLRQVCLEISRALAALQKLDGGGHGNLSLNNVLLTRPDGSGVQLVDPAGHGNAPLKADKRALGLIIYQLINAEFIEHSDMLNSVPGDQNWKTPLGNSGDSWKALCSALLSDYGTEAEGDWTDLAETIENMGGGRGSSAKVLFFATVLTVAIAGSAALVWTLRPPAEEKVVVDVATIQRQWSELLDHYYLWGKNFFASYPAFNSNERESSEFRATFFDSRRQGEMVLLMSRLAGAGPQFISNPGGYETTLRQVDALSLSASDQESIVRTYLFISEMKERIEGWNVVRSLRQSREQFENIGFAFGVAEIDKLSARVDFSNGTMTYQALYGLKALVGDLQSLRSVFDTLQAKLAALLAVPSSRFITSEASRIKATLGEIGGDPVTALRELTAHADSLLNIWQTGQANLATGEFAKAERALDLANRLDLAEWQKLLEDYQQLDPATTAGPRSLLAQSFRNLKELEEAVNDLREDDMPPADFLMRHQTLSNAYEGAVAVDLIALNRPIFEQAARSLEEGLTALTQFAEGRYADVNPDIAVGLEQMLASGRDLEGNLGDAWAAYITQNVQPLRSDSFSGPRDYLVFRRAHERRLANFKRFQADSLAPLQSIAPPRMTLGNAAALHPIAAELWQESRQATLQTFINAAVSDLLGPEYPTSKMVPLTQDAERSLVAARGAIELFLSDVANWLEQIEQWRLPPEGFDRAWSRLENADYRRAWLERGSLQSILRPSLALLRFSTLTDSSELLAMAFTEGELPFARLLALQKAVAQDAGRLDLLEQFQGTDRRWEETIPGEWKDPWAMALAGLWANAYRNASVPDTRWQVASMKDAFNASASLLPDPDRFSFHVFEAIRGIENTPEDYAARPERLRTWLDQLENSPAANSQALITGLREIPLDSSAGGMNDAAFLAQGWEILSASNEHMSLRWEQHTLNFHRLKLAQKDTFVCETEVSIGLLNDWMNARRLWGEAAPVIPNEWNAFVTGRYDPLQDYREGFRIWSASRNGLQRGGLELTGSGFQVDPTVLDEYRRLANQFLPPSIPTAELPMHQTGASLARHFAETVGMRLPTPAEWTEMTALSPGTEPQVWSSQWDDVVSARLRDEMTPGSFYREYRIPASDAARSRGPLLNRVNDGTGPFKQLAGNVAEYVFDPENRRFFVGGGSTLSVNATNWQELHPVAPRDIDRAFSDVGLRLAFDAPLGAPHERYLRLLRESWASLN